MKVIVNPLAALPTLPSTTFPAASASLGAQMLLRKRKSASSAPLGAWGCEKASATDAVEARRGLQSTGGAVEAVAAAAAAGRDAGPAVAGTAAASPPAAMPTPAPAHPQAKRGARKPPVDIGIPTLLGCGMPAAEAAEIVDHMPLGRAGFTQHTLQAACDYLATADPKLVPLIEKHGPPERLLAKGGSNFATLAKAIVFQQLSTHSASAVYGRVLAACGCSDAGGTLTPEAVLAAPLPTLRQAGLSERKASYIVDLAQQFSDGRLSDAKIAAMEEAELEAALCAVRGIGVWTTHMHAMFHLGSPDVLPVGDLGVRKGMMQLYGLKSLPDPAAMGKIAEKWQPYRSIGSYYMWKVEAPARSTNSSGGKSKRPKAS